MFYVLLYNNNNGEFASAAASSDLTKYDNLSFARRTNERKLQKLVEKENISQKYWIKWSDCEI